MVGGWPDRSKVILFVFVISVFSFVVDFNSG